MINIPPPYNRLDNLDQLPREFIIGDHLMGFDLNLSNQILYKLNQYAHDHRFIYTLHVDEFFSPEIVVQYRNLKFIFSPDSFVRFRGWNKFEKYNIHPEIAYRNFLCSFNGTPHVSRKLLVSILKKFRYFTPDTCSKNFSYTIDILDGHLQDYLDPNRQRFYRPFFINLDSEDFFNRIHSFGHVRFDHAQNIHNLEHRLTGSFLHMVSETMATSYYPLVTEKFLYSVVTRGLFLAYAPPGWHNHLEHYYGFRRFERIFDYRFDAIQNPIERLLELMTMISKFAVLSIDDWWDLYKIESDTIEYNYDWYFSKSYLKKIQIND